ncbi:phosphatidylserine decarboxylase-domain-containing protein [Chlamydoabsidia padenii]|nr:phosphatidylserine decarboxylase-domain-containing protein [Chlamydoabsidia padenii]
MAEDIPPTSSGGINIPTNNNKPVSSADMNASDPQNMTPNSRRRLGLFPRTNSQKWLHKPHLAQRQKLWHKRLGQQENDDLPTDPARLVVRLTLSGARHLVLNDENILNPYVIVSCGGRRERTHAIKQTSDPDWSTTFDFPLDGILGHRRKQMALTQGITLTICSKDRFKSVFIGQYRLSLQDLIAFQQLGNKVKWYPIQATPRHRRRFRIRRKAKSATTAAPNSQNSTDTELGGEGGYESGSGSASGPTGEISFKVGLMAKNAHGSIDESVSFGDMEQTWDMVWNHLTAISASSSSETGLYTDNSLALEMNQLQLNPASLMSDDESQSESSDRGIQIRSRLGGPSGGAISSPTGEKQSYSKRRFRRKKVDPVTDTPIKPDGVDTQKRRLRRFRRRRPTEHIAQFRSDVVGIMFMEICHANDLPPEKNVTRTSFDMDPFVIVTFGTSTFRTRSIRHKLNPVWNEKLFFHVRHHESKYKLKFAIYDKDKFSGNDFVAWQDVPIIDIIEQSKDKRQQQDAATLITPDAIDTDMDRNTIALNMVKQDKWQDKHQPTLTLRAKFVPYVEIRKMFWLAMAKTYDIDDNGTMSKLEVQAMLESLGSTITEATLDDFWRQHGKDPTNEIDEISMEDLAQSLEDFMLSSAAYGDDEEVIADPLTSQVIGEGLIPTSDLEFEQGQASNPGISTIETFSPFSDDSYYADQQAATDDDLDSDDILYTDALESSFSDEFDDDDDDDAFLDLDDEDDDLEALQEAHGVQYMESSSPITVPSLGSSHVNQQHSRSSSTSPSSPLSQTQLIYPQQKEPEQQQQQPQPQHHNQYNEKVIRLSECPICHRPNLSRRAQMDIVTHVATCAANDWTTVDRFLMGNFITEQYAQRKWFVKLVSKVGYGKYAPGKNNANIIVQDRKNGQLIEERMSVYIRLGMRLVYKGMKTGIQSKTAKRVLTNMTIRQGKRFDSPHSAREIPAFIKFHRLDMSQVLEPLDHFKTFNEFFYRKLKPGARPCECPDDPRVVVSPADCRMMAFQTIEQATKIWIKGMDFSVAKLLDDPSYAQRFEGGSLAIFRLAPQDYHRFHVPVDGIITETKHLEGQYYTVNPMAIRTTLDVYGDNARSIVRMETKEFGKVAIVCIGAMMVGSIILTAEKNVPLKRTDELGYFAFGGSTLVVIWEKNAIQMDQDLLENSEKSLESLVSVGERIATVCR